MILRTIVGARLRRLPTAVVIDDPDTQKTTTEARDGETTVIEALAEKAHDADILVAHMGVTGHDEIATTIVESAETDQRVMPTRIDADTDIAATDIVTTGIATVNGHLEGIDPALPGRPAARKPCNGAVHFLHKTTHSLRPR